MYSCNDTLAGGLPHSDIHGSTPARGSPWLFAACHVLHRLLVPRHPPNALLMLDTCPRAVATGPDPVVDPRVPDRSAQRAASPCTETILREPEDDPGNICVFRTQPIFPNGHFGVLLTQPVERSIRQNRSQRL